MKGKYAGKGDCYLVLMVNPYHYKQSSSFLGKLTDTVHVAVCPLVGHE